MKLLFPLLITLSATAFAQPRITSPKLVTQPTSAVNAETYDSSQSLQLQAPKRNSVIFEIGFDSRNYEIETTSKRQTYINNVLVSERKATSKQDLSGQIMFIKLQYGLPGNFFVGTKLSRMDMSSSYKSSSDGDTYSGSSNQSGDLEPEVELGWNKKFNSVRLVTGLNHRISMGAAEFRGNKQDAKYGGNFYQPYIGLENDLGSATIGGEIRSALFRERHTKSLESNNTYESRGGSEHQFTGFYEMNSRFRPSAALLYQRKDGSVNETTSEGFSMLGAKAYMQLPLTKTLNVIPSFSYSRALESSVNNIELGKLTTTDLMVSLRVTL